MANKDLFKQPIAEAKSIRESAIANAKEALEESLTPHLKDMLAAKLQEMEDSKVEEETVNESEEVEEAVEETVNETEEVKEETIEEAPKEDEMDEAHGDEEMDEAMDDADDANEAEGDSEESEDEAHGDEELGDLTVDQFKDIIRDVIAQEMEPAGDAIEEPADMDAGDLDVPGEDEAEAEMDGGDEEIDLDELIKELETVSEEEVNEAPKEDEVDEAMHGDKKKDEAMHGKKKDEGKKEDMDEEVKEEVEEEVVNEEVESKEEKSELDQALETIGTLQKELNEVNLLNAKLLYVNKIFKSNDLNESQKVNIIAAFDKAETVKEVKLVYETVSENVVVKAKKETTIKESKLGMASKATGTTASKPEVINEVSDTVRRMQKLAGII